MTHAHAPSDAHSPSDARERRDDDTTQRRASSRRIESHAMRAATRAITGRRRGGGGGGGTATTSSSSSPLIQLLVEAAGLRLGTTTTTTTGSTRATTTAGYHTREGSYRRSVVSALTATSADGRERRLGGTTTTRNASSSSSHFGGKKPPAAAASSSASDGNGERGNERARDGSERGAMNASKRSFGGITRSGHHRRIGDGGDGGSPSGTFRSRKTVDATTDVEWDGATFTGSRLEYAGVEVRGQLHWPIPLHALAQVNPELKRLLEVTRTENGEEERMEEQLSVLTDASTRQGPGEKDLSSRRGSSAAGSSSSTRVIASSAMGKKSADERKAVPGLIEFEQFLVESGWRVNEERIETARRVRATLALDAKQRSSLKIDVESVPLSKTLLGKIKVGELRSAAKDLDLREVMEGVSKKADVVSYLLTFYEYMFGSVEQMSQAGVRMSEVSKISAKILSQANSAANPTKGTQGKPARQELEVESDPSRMNYVKAFDPDELVQLLVRARGIDVMAINVREQCTWTDYLILATARSEHHLKALAGAVLHAVKARTEYVAGGKLQPIIEGTQNGGDKDWMAVDCGSCMVHVFSPEGRERYNLEDLWADGSEVVHNPPERLTVSNIRVDGDETHQTA